MGIIILRNRKRNKKYRRKKWEWEERGKIRKF